MIGIVCAAVLWLLGLFLMLSVLAAAKRGDGK